MWVMEMRRGGSGRKYNVYALARREEIAANAAGMVDIRNSSGRYSTIGRSGRTSRRWVYVEVVRVSCVDSLDTSSAWSVGC